MNTRNIIRGLSALLGLAAIITTGSSCSREEAALFDKSAAERLNEVSDIYSQRFTADGGEWVMEYYPSNSTVSAQEDAPADPSAYGYLMCVKFNADGSTLVGMNNVYSGNAYAEDLSTWDVITDLGPVLSFSSYNECLHTFSNPDPSTTELGDGATGYGLSGDYEFVVIDLEEGAQQAMLKGKKRGTYQRITRLPADTDFDTYITDVETFRTANLNTAAPNYNILHIGGTTYRFRTMLDKVGLLKLWPESGDEIADRFYRTFLVTQRDGRYYLRFRDEMHEGEADNGVQELCYDEASYRFVDEASSSNYIEGANPATFFNEYLNTENKRWTINRGGEKSDAFNTLYNTMATGFTTLGTNSALSRVQLYAGEDGYDLGFTFTYRSGRNTISTTANFIVTVEETANGCNISYVSPADGFAHQVLTNCNGLEAFINAICTNFTAGVATSPFNLTNVKLSAGDIAFTMTAN